MHFACESPTGHSRLHEHLGSQVFSNSLQRYGIIGDALGLALNERALLEAIPAAMVTQLPPIDVYTVDQSGHPVFHYDATAHNVTAALFSPQQPNRALPLSGAAVWTRRGRGTLRGLSTPSPAAGQYALSLTAPGLHGVTAAVYITAGPPAALVLVRPPSAVSDNANALTEQPVLGLRDVAGNDVPGTDAALRGLLLHATVVPHAPEQQRFGGAFVAPLEDGRFHFVGVAVAAVYGRAYHLKFSLALTALRLEVCRLPPRPRAQGLSGV